MEKAKLFIYPEHNVKAILTQFDHDTPYYLVQLRGDLLKTFNREMTINYGCEILSTETLYLSVYKEVEEECGGLYFEEEYYNLCIPASNDTVEIRLVREILECIQGNPRFLNIDNYILVK